MVSNNSRIRPVRRGLASMEFSKRLTACRRTAGGAYKLSE